MEGKFERGEENGYTINHRRTKFRLDEKMDEIIIINIIIFFILVINQLEAQNFVLH